ncbi:Short-chain dehydrogenase [Lachnellula willkommii]|uniref:Short-chain dehydrogenase n=1 Tax=Lachnellula willkommii TaxID=215461 RepID=A0A559MLS7_9HELO|nr:Short-chain dehydrogenase [Lachnellula willkommii]
MASLGKSVLITGCSAGGIGAALAHVFQEKGYHVFASARNPSKIPATLTGAANVTSLTLDVLSPSSIAAAVESVQKKTNGRLDVLINNSGGGYTVPALDASLVQGKELFELNFWAPLAMLQAFAPLLIKAKGCVVNNSSANAYIPMPFMSIYNGSKAALAIASETWRQELQPLGVRTITLVTCAVKTNFFAEYHPAELPDTSQYSNIRDFIRNLTDGRMQGNAISSREYAIRVVREVEKGTVGTVWAGTDAFMARLGWWLSPRSVFDMIVQSIIPVSKEMARAAQKKEN